MTLQRLAFVASLLLSVLALRAQVVVSGVVKDRHTGQPLSHISTVQLDTLKVNYVDGNMVKHEGLIVCNRQISSDLREIFAELYRQQYPIERIRPIAEYGNDDERSMQANNTSCYCYRPIAGSKKLSKHALGMAIDINPLYNPCVRRRKDGTLKVEPSTGHPYVNRQKSFPYKISKNDLCYRLFIQHGFSWGGSWRSLKDYQHFEK